MILKDGWVETTVKPNKDGKIDCAGIDCPLCDLFGPPTYTIVPVWDEREKTMKLMKISKWLYDSRIKPFQVGGGRLVLTEEELTFEKEEEDK